MYVLIVSIICALMLGGVHLYVYEDLGNCILVTFLLFVAIDTGLRAAMNEPSWILKLGKKKKRK